MSHRIAVQAPPVAAPAAGQAHRGRKPATPAHNLESPSLLEEPDSTRRALRLAEDARQRTLASQQAAAEDFAELLSLAYVTFTDFCQTVCMVVRDRRERARLSVEGKPPVDALAFVRTARIAYRAALECPFAALLANCGYDAATLSAALEHLERLAASRQALVKASAGVPELGVVYATAASHRSQQRLPHAGHYRAGAQR